MHVTKLNLLNYVLSGASSTFLLLSSRLRLFSLQIFYFWACLLQLSIEAIYAFKTFVKMAECALKLEPATSLCEAKPGLLQEALVTAESACNSFGVSSAHDCATFARHCAEETERIVGMD